MDTPVVIKHLRETGASVYRTIAKLRNPHIINVKKHRGYQAFGND